MEMEMKGHRGMHDLVKERKETCEREERKQAKKQEAMFREIRSSLASVAQQEPRPRAPLGYTHSSTTVSGTESRTCPVRHMCIAV